MKKKILNHTSIMIVLAVLITFLAASVVTYSKFNTYMQNGVREEARYICLGMEECGDTFLSKRLRAVSSSRVTLIQKDGTVFFLKQFSTQRIINAMRLENGKLQMKGELFDTPQHLWLCTTIKEEFYYCDLLVDTGTIVIETASETNNPIATAIA